MSVSGDIRCYLSSDSESEPGYASTAPTPRAESPFLDDSPEDQYPPTEVIIVATVNPCTNCNINSLFIVDVDQDGAEIYTCAVCGVVNHLA